MNPAATDIDAVAAEIERELREIAAWWSAHAVDREHGGFHGEIDADDTPVPGAGKGIVLNARILWFFSAAGAHLRDPALLRLADRALDYLERHFIDPVHGGVYWELDAEGRPLDTKKQGYAQAFAIYALCAHYRATGRAASIARAHALFALIEAHYLDKELGGYVEAFTADWSPIADMRLSEVDANFPKTMNTHLHILEAYTALHAAAPTAATAQALRRCIDLMLDRFLDPATHHLRLFFESDWTDRSQAVSFGHDIEASWLLWEACEALGDAALSARAAPTLVAMASACLGEAQGPDGGLYNERHRDGKIDKSRIWWVQAEALVGFLNAHELSGDPAFFDAFAKVWSFVRRHHRESSGEWRWWSSLDPVAANRSYKAGFWKGPYHNGRSMIEAGDRLKRLAAPK